MIFKIIFTKHVFFSYKKKGYLCIYSNKKCSNINLKKTSVKSDKSVKYALKIPKPTLKIYKNSKKKTKKLIFKSKKKTEY